MRNTGNRQVSLAAFPKGMPSDKDFIIADAPIPDPGEGQVLCRTIYLSLDPYMRGRMSGRKSYAEPAKIGEPIPGEVVAVVEASRDPAYRPGDIVTSYSGWQDYAVMPGKALRPVKPALAPISTALGVLGMPGMTAYTGLLLLGEPKAGETVFVSAATGAVGSVVGQIAKLKGCRAVGVAGTVEKCRYAVETLGFDACLDHHDEALSQSLAAACPKGIDVNFENVGGKVMWAALENLALHGRVILCGFISQYNDAALPPGPDRTTALLGLAIVKRATIKGLLVRDHWHHFPTFERDMSEWIRTGKVRYREDIVEGLEQAPEAFRGLLSGRNFGKLLVKVSPDPTR